MSNQLRELSACAPGRELKACDTNTPEPCLSSHPTLPSRMGTSERTAACQAVLEAVSAVAGISVDVLLGPGRSRSVSQVRSAAMYLLRTDVGLSARDVGRVLGRNRATVLELSRLVARGERASELVADVRTALHARDSARPDQLVRAQRAPGQ